MLITQMFIRIPRLPDFSAHSFNSATGYLSTTNFRVNNIPPNNAFILTVVNNEIIFPSYVNKTTENVILTLDFRVECATWAIGPVSFEPRGLGIGDHATPLFIHSRSSHCQISRTFNTVSRNACHWILS